jgi:hypothetical protein
VEGKKPLEGKKPFRTQFAMKALDVSAMFQANFNDFRLSGSTPRAPELTVPEGQSTGGGAKAIQSITLAPGDPSAGTLIAGTVNGAANTVELRGYPYLEATYKIRYHGNRLDISAGSYQQFLEEARSFFECRSYTVSLVNQLPDAAKRHYDKTVNAQSGGSAFWIVLGFMVLAGAAVAVYLLLPQ